MLLACNLLFAEMRYNRELETDFLRYSYTVRNDKEVFMVWAKEKRTSLSNNYNYFEITSTNEEKAEFFLLEMSECICYEDFINEYMESHNDLIFIKKSITITYENDIVVNFYYELK